MDLPRYDTIFSQISQALCGQKGKKKSPPFFKEKNRGLFYWNDQANKPGSVVMTIYLDRRLLDGSSHIDRWQNCRKRGRRATVQPFAVTVLLRIGFTWQCSLLHPGELLPRLSTLTPPARSRKRRYISVALFLGSPPADVIRYPCPVQPGLSSCPKARDRLHQS